MTTPHHTETYQPAAMAWRLVAAPPMGSPDQDLAHAVIVSQLAAPTPAPMPWPALVPNLAAPAPNPDRWPVGCPLDELRGGTWWAELPGVLLVDVARPGDARRGMAWTLDELGEGVDVLTLDKATRLTYLFTDDELAHLDPRMAERVAQLVVTLVYCPADPDELEHVLGRPDLDLCGVAVATGAKGFG